VVNTAARLQAAAPENGILVGESTFRATQRMVEYQQATDVQAKGKAAPIAVWEAVQARSRFGVDVGERGAGPLVGRDRELEVLVGALSRVRDERSPQLLTLVGVPGIGKSRLVQELFRVVDADPELIYWRQGRSLPYGEGVSFWALAEMVKAEAGILEGDSAERTEERLRTMLDDAVSDPREREWVLGHVRALVGLGEQEPGGGDRRAEGFAACAACWRPSASAVRSSSCSKTCTGPTTDCSTSSTISSTGRPGCRSSSSARRGPSSSRGGKGGAAASQTPSRSRCRR
jgi:hypothetical protein